MQKSEMFSHIETKNLEAGYQKLLDVKSILPEHFLQLRTILDDLPRDKCGEMVKYESNPINEDLEAIFDKHLFNPFNTLVDFFECAFGFEEGRQLARLMRVYNSEEKPCITYIPDVSDFTYTDATIGDNQEEASDRYRRVTFNMFVPTGQEFNEEMVDYIWENYRQLRDLVHLVGSEVQRRKRDGS